MFRELHGADSSVSGDAVFWLYLFDTAVTYSMEVDYMLDGGDAVVEMCRGGTVLQSMSLPASREWRRATITSQANGTSTPPSDAPGDRSGLKTVHWPGLGGLRVQSVRILDEQGMEGVHFQFGKPMSIEIQIVAEQSGTFPVQAGLSVYRRGDGVYVTQCIGPCTTHTWSQGETMIMRLNLGPLQLGNDTYVVAVVLLRSFDPSEIKTAERYDLLDRSVEFKVHGREPYRRGIFQHPGEWVVEESAAPLLKSAG
jgi:hypothetical protein